MSKTSLAFSLGGEIDTRPALCVWRRCGQPRQTRWCIHTVIFHHRSHVEETPGVAANPPNGGSHECCRLKPSQSNVTHGAAPRPNVLRSKGPEQRPVLMAWSSGQVGPGAAIEPPTALGMSVGGSRNNISETADCAEIGRSIGSPDCRPRGCASGSRWWSSAPRWNCAGARAWGCSRSFGRAVKKR